MRLIGREFPSQIKNLKSAIEPKCLPNIPTSASGSEFPQLIMDQIFPADYSQLTQPTFSSPPGVNLTAHKQYSRSQKLPPKALGMIISAILSLMYNIPCRDSHILNLALNPMIKSIISRSGGHPTPAFHIPQYCSTRFEYPQLEPLIEKYICCPQCFFLNGLTESVTTYQPHCQFHDDPNDHDSPFTQSLGRFINSFEPRMQKKTNMKQKFIATKHLIYQPFKNWLARFLQRVGVIEILHQHQHFQITKGSPKCDILDGLVWRRFNGSRNINDPPIHVHSCERLKPENVYVTGIIPGPKEPTALQLNYLLMPLIKDLKDLWQGCHLSPTSTGSSGSLIRVAILTAIADVVAMQKLAGFISHSGIHFCNFSTIHKAQIKEIGPQFHYTRSCQNYKSTIAKWVGEYPQQRQAILSEYGVQYSILVDLLYWDSIRMVNIDIMHNLILGILDGA
ncbi:hypothetical protein O181_018745 [Austropuccinia psidii MF-1]|uniref:Uncharacterized protein n=1 Tax=Austropuccinia psidii MF-1 TaxID=1389203 RepID=A0A9Q3C999_9BASI|nr:hypothetical protein [Austropuccinia psidii MF-1]